MSARREIAVLLTITLVGVFIACGQTEDRATNSPSATALGATATADAQAHPAAADNSDTPTPDVAPAPVQTAPPPTAPPASEPTRAPTAAPAQNCSPAYPDFCIPSPPPDLDCPDIGRHNFTVLAPDPHRFDADHDGIGCES